ncbi:hypothetical protein [Methanobacterium sp.]
MTSCEHFMFDGSKPEGFERFCKHFYIYDFLDPENCVFGAFADLNLQL